MRRITYTAVTLTILAVATAYLVAGILLGSAAYMPGSSIRYGHPLVWASLPMELSRPSWEQALPFFPWFIAPLFAAIVGSALLISLSAAQPTRRRVPVAKVILIIGCAPAAWGAWSFLFSLLNASLWGGLDGEWLDEFHPVYEAFFFAYATMCVALVSRSRTELFSPKVPPNDEMQLTSQCTVEARS